MTSDRLYKKKQRLQQMQQMPGSTRFLAKIPSQYNRLTSEKKHKKENTERAK